MLSQPNKPVGLVGYGAYVPRFRLPGAEISRIWSGEIGIGESSSQKDDAGSNGQKEAGPIKEKAVPGLDEDTATMSIEAARNALARSRVDPQQIQAVWVGSESHPYAVKPTGTIVAEAIGATPATQAADLQFACKAGTEAMQAAIGFVGSGMAPYALAIGMDTAQGRPGDALEYTAGAGGAAMLIGPAEESVAVIERSLSYVSDTNDFWRRPRQNYPSHAERFSGDPGYFSHLISAAERMMDELDVTATAFDHVVVHQPNVKFPVRAMRALGFSREQWQLGLLVGEIGNTYAGSAILGLTAILDEAEQGQRVLVVSYGSGAGSDVFALRLTNRLPAWRNSAPATRDYIRRRVEIDYAQYARLRGKLALH
ncbi:MAG: hydroxymethylglutaryl-CoA synthase [Caldilineaceae bacterium]|nr:hydroxymethylglutaryl-CoA synthase [Caldilineaceae bacterium]